MLSQRVFNVYELSPVPNVCNQILREVISLSAVSIAHVTMEPQAVSLWHRHSKMHEIYYVLGGRGVIFHGDRSILAEHGTSLMLPPFTPHKLRNLSTSPLEHLVLAIPPFNPQDVELIPDAARETSVPETFRHVKNPILALDGALIYEIAPQTELKALDIGLAVGFLPPKRKAIPHRHEQSEEVYYISSGVGRVSVERNLFHVQRGTVISLPTSTIHALENTSETEDLEVVCLSYPAYTDEDFIFV